MKLKLKIDGAEEDTMCGCGDWLKHWERFSRQDALYCSESSCMARDVVAAKVTRIGNGEQSTYVIPLCTKHAAARGEFRIASHIKLIPARPEPACQATVISEKSVVYRG